MQYLPPRFRPRPAFALSLSHSALALARCHTSPPPHMLLIGHLCLLAGHQLVIVRLAHEALPRLPLLPSHQLTMT